MSTKSWFREQILARAIASAVWTVLLQLPLLLLLKFLFSGYQGVWNSFSLLRQFGSFFSFILIPLSVCGLTFTHLKFFKTQTIVYPTRWSLLKEVFSPNFASLLGIYGLIGGVLMNSYFSTSVPFLGSLSTHCTHRNGWCLNELHLFGVLFGGLLGLSEGLDYYFTDRRMVKIPHVQQHVKVAVWASLFPLIKTSLMLVVKRYLLQIVLYFLTGGVVRSYILGATRLSLDEPLDTIVGLLSVSLAIRCILIGSACVFTIRLSNLLFQLYEIKPIAFPVARFGDDSTPLLQEAITSDIPLLRLWACRDWSILAEQSSGRRSIIFSVSQPGNHPHNWNSIVSSILPQCLEFLSELKGEVKEVKKEVTPPQSPVDTVTSPTRMRSMALKSPVRPVQSPVKQEASQSSIQKKIQEAVDNFKKNPVIHFVWGELPDAKRRQMFAKAEPIILLIEGLSHFLTASFTEDTFGVVQKDLSEILGMLLDFQSEMEVRRASSVLLPKRADALTNPPADVNVKHRLKWTVKSSIYRLVVRFQRHIMNIALPASQKRTLEQYLEFRVG